MADDAAEPMEIVFTEGPLTGQRFAVPEDQPLILGRTRKGIDLKDNLASLEHAEISFRSGIGYVIRDLDSQSGTFVDGRSVTATPTRISAGCRIAIGESVLTLEDAPRRAGMKPLYGIAGIVALLAVGFGLVLVQQTGPRAWGFTFRDDLRVPGGVTHGFEFPEAFARREGLVPGTFSVREVGDANANQIDELWLDRADGSLVLVEVQDADHVAVVGELPAGCRSIQNPGRPAFDCGGDLWTWTRDGVYPYAADGVVVIGRSTTPAADPNAAPTSATVALRVRPPDVHQLAGFLAARGVSEGVHYLLCEGAVAGARAQVLTASGRLEALDFGCLGNLRVSPSPEVAPDGYFMGEVYAIAFTANGRRALAMDVATFAGGGPASPFLGGDDLAFRQIVTSTPIPRQVREVVVDADLGYFEAVAPEEPIQGVRSLLPNGQAEGRPAPTVSTTTLDGTGTVEIAAGGCSQLRVTTNDWGCELSHLCFPNRQFLEVRQVGCGRDASLLTVPYTGGSAFGGDADLELNARVEVSHGRGRVDVVRTMLTWRARGG